MIHLFDPPEAATKGHLQHVNKDNPFCHHYTVDTEIVENIKWHFSFHTLFLFVLYL